MLCSLEPACPPLWLGLVSLAQTAALCLKLNWSRLSLLVNSWTYSFYVSGIKAQHTAVVALSERPCSLQLNDRYVCSWLLMFLWKCCSKLNGSQWADLGSGVGRELLCGDKAGDSTLGRERETDWEWEARSMLWNLPRGFWVNVHGWQPFGMLTSGEF